MPPVRSEIKAEALIEAILSKLKAMEDLNRGLLFYGVTETDRIAVIMSTFKKKYYQEILSTQPKPEDIEYVVEASDKFGVELTEKEIAILSIIRRFLIDNGKKRGIMKLIDIDEEEREDIGKKVYAD